MVALPGLSYMQVQIALEEGDCYTVARAGQKKQKSENGNGAPLGFEAKLWLAADKPKLLIR